METQELHSMSKDSLQEMDHSSRSERISTPRPHMEEESIDNEVGKRNEITHHIVDNPRHSPHDERRGSLPPPYPRNLIHDPYRYHQRSNPDRITIENQAQQIGSLKSRLYEIARLRAQIYLMVMVGWIFFWVVFIFYLIVENRPTKVNETMYKLKNSTEMILELWKVFSETYGPLNLKQTQILNHTKALSETIPS